MTTVDFIITLFCQVDTHMQDDRKHPHATLWPNEVVTLGTLHRLFMTHQEWAKVFLASPTVLGTIDTYGIELIHSMREGRSSRHIGRKGLSHYRKTDEYEMRLRNFVAAVYDTAFEIDYAGVWTRPRRRGRKTATDNNI
jgi:hypothetical protein